MKAPPEYVAAHGLLRGKSVLVTAAAGAGIGFAVAQRAHFGGPLILNDGFDATSAEAALAAGQGEAISFARHFIANPDLVERLRQGFGEPAGAAQRAAEDERSGRDLRVQCRGVGGRVGAVEVEATVANSGLDAGRRVADQENLHSSPA